MNNPKLQNKIIYSSTFSKFLILCVYVSFTVFSAQVTVEEAASKLISHSKKMVVHNGETINFHPSEILDIIAREGHSLPENVKNELIELGFDFSRKIVSQGRPFIEDELTIDSGIFRFHYTLSGGNAVLPEDDEENGIPDYVDSMMAAFDAIAVIDFDRENYTLPPSDDWYFNQDDGGSEHFDVYIYELYPGYYGFVQAEDYAQNFSELTRGDNENSPDDEESNAIVSWMGMRNNYSDFPGTESKIIQVTSAHEFYHSIQFGYDAWEGAWIKEASATWMEEIHYDDINDCYQFLIDFFKYPGRGPNYDVDRGYGSYIYISYLVDNHFDMSFMKNFWKNSISHDSYDSDYSIITLKETMNQDKPIFSSPVFNDNQFEKITNDFLIANALVTNNAIYDSIYHYDEVSNENWPINTVLYEQEIDSIGTEPTFIANKVVGTFGAHYYKVNVNDSTLHNISVELLPYYPEEGNMYLTIINNDSIQTTHMDEDEQVIEVDVTDSSKIVFLVSAFTYIYDDLYYAVRIVPNSTASSNNSINTPVDDDTPPILTFIGDQITVENASLSLTLSATDVDGDILSFSAMTNNENVSVSVDENILTITPLADYIGSILVTVIVSDGFLSDNEIFMLTFTPANSLPTEFYLKENFPNPFNPFTTISFSVLQPSKMSIEIFNVKGQLINFLETNAQLPGEYSVVWDATDKDGKRVESGIYLYNFNVNGIIIDSRKMVFLK